MPLASNGGDVASPFASVLTLGCPRNVALAPVTPGTTAKSTVAPCTGLPFASSTCACSGCANCALALASCDGAPAAIDAASPAAVFHRYSSTVPQSEST